MVPVCVRKNMRFEGEIAKISKTQFQEIQLQQQLLFWIILKSQQEEGKEIMRSRNSTFSFPKKYFLQNM